MWIYDLKSKIQEEFSERGQGMVEYAIVLAFVAVVSVAVFLGSDSGGRNVSNAVVSSYDKANDAINQIEVHNVK